MTALRTGPAHSEYTRNVNLDMNLSLQWQQEGPLLNAHVQGQASGEFLSLHLACSNLNQHGLHKASPQMPLLTSDRTLDQDLGPAILVVGKEKYHGLEACRMGKARNNVGKCEVVLLNLLGVRGGGVWSRLGH